MLELLKGVDPNWMSAAGALLAVVLSAYALRQSHQSARASANASVFDLYQSYLSLDFHSGVRTPAWHALRRARMDPNYRERLLQELLFASPDDSEHHARHERRRSGTEWPEDREFWQFHDEYHRVADILGFFTTLSLLHADQQTVRMCNFLYDSWRSPLHRVVADLEDHLARTGQANDPRADIKARRLGIYRHTLLQLDKVYGLPPVDRSTDPYFQEMSPAPSAEARPRAGSADGIPEADVESVSKAPQKAGQDA